MHLGVDFLKAVLITMYILFVEFLQGINEKITFFPSQEDLVGAATALLRIQDTYSIPSSKIAAGDLEGAKYTAEMTGMHINFSRLFPFSKLLNYSCTHLK